MSKLRFIITISVFSFGFILMFGCKKKDGDNGDPAAPVATTRSASLIGRGWATLYGTVDPKNQITTVSFEYDTTTAYKNSVEAVPDTIKENKATSVLANISGLLPSREYHFRVKAVNKSGTTYGSDQTFKTTTPKDFIINFREDITYGTVTDYEGNTYKTVTIGTQTWMAENLRSLKLNDGTTIPFLPDYISWSSAETPGYCWFDNDSVGYGALYNWYTVNTGKLCPAGWHVPSDDEWTTLTSFLGGLTDAGKKLKETGTSHWLFPNTGATNESGFTALPGGYRGASGFFRNIGNSGYWWTSTESLTTDVWYRSLNYNYSNVDRTGASKKCGLSVRCIQD